MVEGELESTAWLIERLDRAACLARPGNLEASEPHAHVLSRCHRAVELPRLHQRVVGDRDDPGSRIAVGRAERVQLLGEDVGQPNLRLEHAGRRGIERLSDAEEAPRQGPAPPMRMLRATRQQRRDRAIPNRQQHDVDGHRRPRKDRRVVARQERLFLVDDLAIRSHSRAHLLDATHIYA